ncbi:alpha/beta fold hydrolase [Pelodictyon luteolum]|uniref:Lipolytic enzyme n=1 Tax=Chlorobium luteolum (strain DSM 273 / BCRC 81028 / 2530) TaxID=319225 RepID=Q3B4H8_CHLL3|nr:alpha/beta hydrolase [Pelodictyon luteolum]ABB23753.1 lipolytic enzyme [Pelodictyon luteolum DSM 273]
MNSHQPLNGKSGETFSMPVDDISMSCRVFGEGYPLVFIMGYGSTMNLWEPGLLDLFASRFKVIVFDNRGMGDTGEGTEDYSIVRMADDTAGLMRALNIQQAHVLGWSMGSLVAQELAFRHPSLLSKLVLYAAHCDAQMFPPSLEVLSMLTDTSGSPEERGMRYISVLFPEAWMEANGQRLKEIFYRPMGRIPEDITARQSAAIDAWSGTTERLPMLDNPTLIITGSDDRLVSPHNARYLAEKIPQPHAQLCVVEHAGHGLMFQYPELFFEKVAAFLQ